MLKKRTKERLIFAICIIIYLVLIYLLSLLNREGSFRLGNTLLAYASLSGVLQSIQMAICVILVRVDYKYGTITAVALICISIFTMLRVVFLFSHLAPLPGIFNLLVLIACLVIIARQFRRMEKDSVSDYLTGLWNRRGILEIVKSKTENKLPFSILYLDLENFKIINDELGHTCGDKVLKHVAKVMKANVGKDVALGRMSGDEFIFVLPSQYEPLEVSERIITVLSEKFEIEAGTRTSEHYVTANIGISQFPTDTNSAETLLQYADIAMYHAMNSSSDNICFFNKDMEEERFKEMKIQKVIKEGFDNNRFEIVYQPQFTTNEKELRGFEALLRLTDSKGENVSPGTFIPVAEKNELIFQIDDYVIDRVMQEFRQPLLNADKTFLLSVNVSAKNIASDKFFEKIATALQKNDFPPECLEIEITEYCLATSMDKTMRNITELKKLGVKIALDDFGTGYSSLSYLSTLSVDLLKIDKSMVDEITTSQKNRDFVKMVVSLGHTMGCEVITEGVEHESQVEILKEQECDFIQGYVWSRPLKYQAALDLCREQNI